MQSEKSVHELILEDIINFIYDNKTEDGSFKTMYCQPHYQPEKGWMNYPVNSSFCTAAIGINLLSAKTDNKIKELLDNATSFLLKQSFRKKMWTFGAISPIHRLPFDSDTTSLSSFFLEKMGHLINNKTILSTNVFNNSFYVWITNYSLRTMTFLDALNARIYFKKVKKCAPIQNKIIDLNESELIIDCNNLLYLGKKGNEVIVERMMNDILEEKFEMNYYLSEIQILFSICRLHYHNVFDIKHYPAVHKIILERAKEQIENCKKNEQILDRLYLAIIFLYLSDFEGVEQMEIPTFLDFSYRNKCYKHVAPFYTSNNKLDISPDTGKPSTFFGSDIYVSSVYIEFLNLYKEFIIQNGKS